LGTCLGISAAYIASAMPTGILHTLEGAPALSSLAEQHFNAANGFGNIRYYTGPFSQSLPQCLKGLEAPVDFAFIDGHHDGRACMMYWKKIRPLIKSPSVVIFDDIRFNAGMTKAWKKIRSGSHIPAYSVLKPGLNPLRRMGLIIYDPSNS
jgi:predicted O-methyltransferase YrrM